jgi:hypothetical protein
MVGQTTISSAVRRGQSGAAEGKASGQASQQRARQPKQRKCIAARGTESQTRRRGHERGIAGKGKARAAWCVYVCVCMCVCMCVCADGDPLEGVDSALTIPVQYDDLRHLCGVVYSRHTWRVPTLPV